MPEKTRGSRKVLDVPLLSNLETVSLGDLVPDSANARIHSERNVKEIMRSLVEFGQHAPLVVQRSTNRILVGNGRYEAMTRLGWDKALVLYVDDDNITAIRRSLADNRTGDLSKFDDEILTVLFNELGENVDVPGWDEDEIIDILGMDESIPEPDDNPSETLSEGFKVTVECESYEEAEEVYREMKERGFKCQKR